MPMYLRCSALIEKQVFKNILLFEANITILGLMFQIFTRILLVEDKNFELLYLHKKLSYASAFR